MSRADYLDSRRSESPESALTASVARAHLAVAGALAKRREALGITPAQLAERTGVTAERVPEIEEGDTTSLTEVLRLCDGLGLRLDVVPLGSSLAAAPDRAARVERVRGVA